MKVQVNQKIDGVGNKLFNITYTDCGGSYSEMFIGNDDKDVLKQFFTRNNWNEDYVNETFSNMNWVFTEDEHWDDEDWEENGEGFERIELDVIGDIE
jgi:hypothetical protein